MRQFNNIAVNAFMELVRQPVFLLLLTCSMSFSVFLAIVPYFGFGEDQAMVKTSALAVMLLSGLFGAVLSASSSVASEIRSGTALAVLSKPVGRARFLLAKYVGLAAALTVLSYANMIGVLLASRMAYDAYGSADTQAAWIFFGSLAAAYGVAGLSNYFLNRPFVADAVWSVLLCATLAFVVIAFFVGREASMFTPESKVDWRLVPAGVLILFALLILASLAIACSTRLEMIPTLAICSAFFLLGLMSDYLFGRPAERGAVWASVCYTIMPNWQLLWLADALENKKSIPWSYIGKACGYVLCYLAASLSAALILFDDRELN